MLDNIIIFKQNSIKIDNIYIDPYGVDKAYHDAKYIFITHSHYDHWSKEDIEKVKNQDTMFIVPLSMKDEYEYSNEVLFVEPNKKYILENISFQTVRMYNIDKEYHPLQNNWCGYIIAYDKMVYYIMGDTDNISEINNINCDIVFVPIGGTFTMDVAEAIDCLKKINYHYVIPVHYGSIVGHKNLGVLLQKRIGDKCIVKIR